MYVPEYSRMTDRILILDLIRSNSFATLVLGGSELPQIVHLPLIAEEDEPLILSGHVAKANPIWKRFDGSSQATAVFHGPHAYLSPRNYVSAPNVPTWNYAVVHASGVPRIVSEKEEAVQRLKAMVDQFDPSLGKVRPEALTEADLNRLSSGVVCFTLLADRIVAKHKMSQNKPMADQRSAVEALVASGREQERSVAEWMRRTQSD